MILSRVASLFVLTQLCIGGVSSVFSPNVTVQSCTSRRVVIHLARAVDGGLVYIQGRGSACSHTTNTNNMDVTFDFTMCSIEYDVKFRLVVQQNPRYQTGTDKVIPIMCLVDMADLEVSGVIFPEETLDKSVNKTTTPTLRMRVLLANDVNGDDVILEEVTLDDKLKLNLRLDDPFLSDFDIKAKDCSAALIPIIKDECSPDEELFPNFKKKTPGDIMSTFRAFQPTNIAGEPDVDVSFTCSVSVCRGKCSNAVCGEVVGWGRRKRDSEPDVIVEKVTVGTTLRVKSPGQHKAIGQEQPVYCAEKVVVTTVTTITAATLIFSWIVCGCVVTKLRTFGRSPGTPRKPNAIRRLSGANMNFARSVGRRLSTILNLPVGYDMNAPKMMDCIPEAECTPETKRRDSVVVSDDVNTNNDDVRIGACGVRKRCVDVGSQTDNNINNKTTSMKASVKKSSKPFGISNPISFLSEKYRSSAFDLKQTPTLENDKNITQARSRKSGNGIMTDSCISKGKLNPTFVHYESDEVPKHRSPYIGTYRARSISVPKDNEIQNDEPKPEQTNRLDLKMFQNKHSNINRPSVSDSGVFEPGYSTHLDVQYDRNGSETPPVDYDCPTEEQNTLPSHIDFDNDSTETINDDVFFNDPHTVNSTQSNTTQHTEYDVTRRMRDPRGGTSVYNEMTDIVQYKTSDCSEIPKRNENDSHGNGSVRLRSSSTDSLCDSKRVQYVTSRDRTPRERIHSDGIARDEVSRDIHIDDDGLYEPIEFGAQLKRNRTHSTHV